MLPALNVRGIQSGHVEAQASNTIQTEASASIDFRLVPNETPDSIKPLVESHIQEQGYFIVRDTPDAATRLAHPKIAKVKWGAGYPPARTRARSSAFTRSGRHHDSDGSRTGSTADRWRQHPDVFVPAA